MAHIYRLICFLLLSIPVTSMASFPAPPGWDTQCVPARYPWPYQANYPATWVCIENAGFNSRDCGWNFQGDQGPARSVQCSQAKTPPSCPANSTLAAGQCTCSAGHRETASNNACEPIPCEPPNEINAQGQCKPPINNCPKPGTAGGHYNLSGGMGASSPALGAVSLCDDQYQGSGDPSKPGCAMGGHSSFASRSGDSEPWYLSAAMSYTGDKCKSGSGPPPIKDDGLNCKPPQVEGMVNGYPRCYTPAPGGTTSSNGKPTTSSTQNPDGSTSKTDSQSKTDCKAGVCTTTTTHTTTNTSSSGTTGAPTTTTNTSQCQQGPGCGPIAPVTGTTTTTTTNPDGTKTTTTNTTTGNPTGSTSGTTTGSGNNGSGSSGNGNGSGNGDGDGDGEESMFGGVCGSPPVCAGDAIQCAVAAATFSTNCALTTAPAKTGEAQLYETEAAKDQGDQTGPITRNLSIGPAAFDQSNAIGGGGGGGMSDLNVSVMGVTVALPFSVLNPWLSRLGLLLKAITFLICARVLLKSGK